MTGVSRGNWPSQVSCVSSVDEHVVEVGREVRHGVGRVLALVEGIKLSEGIPDGRHLEQVSCPTGLPRNTPQGPARSTRRAVLTRRLRFGPGTTHSCVPFRRCQRSAFRRLRCLPCITAAARRVRRDAWAVGLDPLPFQRIAATAGVCNLWVLSCRVCRFWPAGVRISGSSRSALHPFLRCPEKFLFLAPDRPGTGRDLRRSCAIREFQSSGARGVLGYEVL